MPELRKNELPEFSISGPFGGIQSELSLDQIEGLGFVDALNVMFRKGEAASRPAFNGLAPLVDVLEPVLGIADFFRSDGVRVQVVMTPTRLLRWDGGIAPWTEITGDGLSGSEIDLFTWTVVAGKLCFCQGIDKVKIWDGYTATYTAIVDSVPARYLFELGNRLVALFTYDAGAANPQRLHWSAIGDPTDWTTVAQAGQEDLFNALGPITNACKLFQSGYIWQQWGITQMLPTGNALLPFQFVPISAHSKGNICPHSLAAFGEDLAAYVGKNNIYAFDGAASVPIGDFPIGGTRARTGARKRIFADLASCRGLQLVLGFISTSLNGNDYKAYWLFVPDISIWVYNFDEGNWTRFSAPRVPRSVGVFSGSRPLTIANLVGAIQDQSWSPDTIQNDNPLDAMMIGTDDGLPLIFDFSGACESPGFLQTGQMVFGDRRHAKTVKRIRTSYRDLAVDSAYTLTLNNEEGQTQVRAATIGSGSNKVARKMSEFSLSGEFIELRLDFDANQALAFTDLALIYDIGGENRGG